MKRMLPFPLASAGLLMVWLLLNQSLSPAHLLLGGVVALAGGRLLAALEPPKGRLRRLAPIVRLAGFVAADVIRSNIAVALIVLGIRDRHREPGFVHIPLDLRQPYGLAMLACIITSTPGTLWVSFDEASGLLTIHVLDLIDENQWIRTIKSRYERLLLEICA